MPFRNPFADGEAADVEGESADAGATAPWPYPRWPTRLTPGDAADFVAAYEQVYVLDQVLGDGAAAASVDTWGEMVRAVDDGYLVSLRATYWSGRLTRRTGATLGAGTTGRAPEYQVTYHVAEDRLVRAEGDYTGAPDPRERGTVLERR